MTPHEEPPPILGTWNRLYAAVVMYLVVIIILFFIFEKVFA